MTVKELIKASAGLFGETTHDQHIFYTAANRALDMIHSLRPAIGEYMLYHYPLPAISASDIPHRISPASGGFISLSAEDVYSFYVKISTFAASAAVTVMIAVNGAERETCTVKGSTVIKRDLLSYGENCADVTIKLSSQSAFSIDSYALYSDRISTNADDIPLYESECRYNLADIIEDYQRLSGYGITKDKKKVYSPSEYELNGMVLTLPREAQGAYLIKYERSPQRITSDFADKDIDVSRELEPLMPLLTGYFAGLDTDFDTAMQCYARYTDLASSILSNESGADEGRVVSATGW